MHNKSLIESNLTQNIFHIFISFFLVIGIGGCKKEPVYRIHGEALGTFYSISYTGIEHERLLYEADSVLKSVSDRFSIFDSLSTLSRINRGMEVKPDRDFIEVIRRSLAISELTNGAFDITLAPLIDLWGFGKTEKKDPTPEMIDSVKQIIGYQKISILNDRLVKEDDRIRINMNAIAKGFAADQLACFLYDKGYRNFIVEVGGEIVTKGTKSGKPWKVGIQVPVEQKDGPIDATYAFPLQDKAIATSGSYRNYFEEDGIRYMHIIDPESGRPKTSRLLSVTVIAGDCMTADALATAFMLLGEKESMRIAEENHYEAYFILSDDNGKFRTLKTAGFPEEK